MNETFKWNPFTLEGEAPASLRWRANDDELEFASKEDLEEIAKNPAMQKLYNAIKAGVTKKFQEWSKATKSLQERSKQLETKIYEWEDWYGENYDEEGNPFNVANPNDVDANAQRRTTRTRSRGGDEPIIQDVIDAVNKAGTVFEKRLGTLEKGQQGLSNAFTLSLDLIEQKFSHPEMDIQKVLKTAQDKGFGDFGTAYEVTYRDELVKKQVDDGVKKGLEEKEAERKKTLETGGGTLPITFEKPKEVAKSFSEGTKQFLEERAREGTK